MPVFKLSTWSTLAAVALIVGHAGVALAQITPPSLPRQPNPGSVPPPQINLNPLIFSEPREGVMHVSAWTGASIAIATAGGTPPVTFTVTANSAPGIRGSDDAPDAELFEIVSVPRDRQVSSQTSKPVMIPVLKFKGFGLRDARLTAGRDISVTLKAKDSRGVTATRTFTLLAVPGRVATLSLTNPAAVRAQNTRVQVALDLLPPNARIEFLASETHLSGQPDLIPYPKCRFIARTTPAAVTSDALGRASFNLDGVFNCDDDTPTGPCTAGMKLSVTAAGQAPEQVYVFAHKNTATLRTPTVYRVDQTWSLRSKFDFQVTPGVPGVCTGSSVFTSGSFPIGVFENGSHDLTIAIRSGPVGTDCAAVSSAWALPEGFALKAIDWAVSQDGTKCCPGDDCLPSGSSASSGTVVPGAIPSDDVERFESVSSDNPLQDELGYPAGSNPSRLVRRVFNRSHVRLGCKESDSNDHGVRVTLRSVTFEGPAGQTFP